MSRYTALALIVLGVLAIVVVARVVMTKREQKRVLAARLEATRLTRRPSVAPESPYTPPFNKQVPLNPRPAKDPLTPRPARPKINPHRSTLRDDNIHTTPVYDSQPSVAPQPDYDFPRSSSGGWSGGGSSYDTSSDSGTSGGSDGGGGGGGGGE